MLFLKLKYVLLFNLTCLGTLLLAQPQQSKWYFGAQAGLDFMTTPPTVLTNGAMTANFGCASQADAAGNLLFYTDGVTIYNSSHLVMANGTGLLGIGSPAQPCLVVRQPGSANLHYIFTVVGNGWPGGLNYSIVDMSLAAGFGSVTAKNYSLYTQPVDEKITGTMHCNGTDYWIVIHQNNSNSYRSYLLTASGVNTVAVVSSVGPVGTHYNCKMRISPTGSKLATTERVLGNSAHSMSLYDFDNSNGTVSNYQSLYSAFDASQGNGVEFSPDGSLVYGFDNLYSGNNSSSLHQWNLCAGLLPAVIASHYSVATSSAGSSLQLAINGKIYSSQTGNAPTGYNSIGVINNPNNPGAACNYVVSGQTLSTKISASSLPNFITHYKSVLFPFSYSLVTGVACHAMSFTANLPAVTCAASNYSVNGLVWNFGDPTTGTFNSSFSPNPTHVYSSSGTYTTTLIFYYKCSSDTIRQTVYVPPPFMTVASSTSCVNAASATVSVVGGIGPYTYSWVPSSQTGSFVSNLSPGSHTIAVVDVGLSCTIYSVISVAPIIAPTMSLAPSGSISVCQGSNVTVRISGNVSSYVWAPLNGLSINNNTVMLNPPASQIYTVVGTLNSCTISATVDVTILPLPIPTITVNKNTLCVNTLLEMQGAGGAIFQWSGPSGFSSSQQQVSTVLNSVNAAGSYTLKVTDDNGCQNTATTEIKIAQPPQGQLKGVRPDACAPICLDYQFEKPLQQASVISMWEINGSNFGSNFTYCFNDPGNFKINGTLTDTLSLCTTKLSYLVVVSPKPNASFEYSPNAPVAEMDEVKFINSSLGEDLTTWSWFFKGTSTEPALLKASGREVKNRFSQPGNYVAALVVTNGFGCADTIIKTILVNEDFTLFVPNSFTPNGDLHNEIFLPVARGLKTFSLFVFNRWGTRVFETKDASKGWDGNFKGEPAPEGIYIWEIQYSADGNRSGAKNGHVLLTR